MATPAAALALTVAIEWLVYWASLRRAPAALAGYALAVNALTEPLASYAYQRLGGDLWAVEAAVWLAEGLLLRALLGLRPGRALALSAAANLASALAGLVVFWLR
ncbi:MAG TPA: hypothetical protein VFL91_18625 [Thermomicrobiales bacterium]|nr:hypothetical protein [Thermomicrobiales bacterium]